MFYTVLNESQVYADAILNAPGVLLDLRDSPQVGSGWATYLGVDESDLVLPGGRSATVRICRKSVEELTPRQRRKQMRKEIAPRMAAEVASEEGVECDPLQLVAGLAMKEASSILDDKDHPVGGYFDIPPKEWGAEVMKQLRILGGRRLAMLGTTKAKAKRAKVIENLTISMEYVSTTYLGGTVTSPPQVASDKTLESPTDEGEEAPHVETQAVTFNDIVEGNAFLSGGVEHVKSGSSESVVFDGEEITSFNWGGEEEVGAL